jgi:hypothetical protein
MKAAFFLLFVLPFTAQAISLQCPEGSKVLDCREANQATDSSFAKSFMDAALICQTSQGLNILLSSQNRPFTFIPVKEIVYGGATSYQFAEDAVDYALVRTISSTKVNATFTILLNGKRSTRSLSCQ